MFTKPFRLGEHFFFQKSINPHNDINCIVSARDYFVISNSVEIHVVFGLLL